MAWSPEALSNVIMSAKLASGATVAARSLPPVWLLRDQLIGDAVEHCAGRKAGPRGQQRLDDLGRAECRQPGGRLDRPG
jgi:hypothetical protein